MSSLVRRKKALGVKGGCYKHKGRAQAHLALRRHKDGMVASLGNTVRSRPV